MSFIRSKNKKKAIAARVQYVLERKTAVEVTKVCRCEVR